MPIVTKQYSLKPDMGFGWKPVDTVNGAPIPLYYDYETFEVPENMSTKEPLIVNYYGPRFNNSMQVHKAFANQVLSKEVEFDSWNRKSYEYKIPQNRNVLEAIEQGQKMQKRAVDY